MRTSSTTSALVRRVLKAVTARRDSCEQLIELAPLATELAVATTGGKQSAAVSGALEAVSAGDLLVIGTPVYKGSYTGLFKMFFDIVDQGALADKVVLLTAAGGNSRHSLVIDHELRPLFAFFGATTAPLGVYATRADYVDGEVSDSRLLPAIDDAVRAALALLRGSSPVCRGGAD